MLRRRVLFLSLGFAALLTLLGLVMVVRVAADGLGRNRTILSLYAARIAWKQGRSAYAVQTFLKSGWLALEGGARWEVAQYYLQQSADLKRRHHLGDAAQACLRAADILGPFDNLSRQDRQCDLMSWEYEQSP
jgi:hypothetical protein